MTLRRDIKLRFILRQRVRTLIILKNEKSVVTFFVLFLFNVKGFHGTTNTPRKFPSGSSRENLLQDAYEHYEINFPRTAADVYDLQTL